MSAKERVYELICGDIPPGLTRAVILDAIDAAVKEEREACAAVADIQADAYNGYGGEALARTIAYSIRKRGQP